MLSAYSGLNAARQILPQFIGQRYGRRHGQTRLHDQCQNRYRPSKPNASAPSSIMPGLFSTEWRNPRPWPIPENQNQFAGEARAHCDTKGFGFACEMLKVLPPVTIIILPPLKPMVPGKIRHPQIAQVMKDTPRSAQITTSHKTLRYNHGRSGVSSFAMKGKRRFRLGHEHS